MPTTNIIGEFDAAGCRIQNNYSNFSLNDITNSTKQQATLLSACQLIQNLSATEKPSTKLFDELVQLVQNHLQPPPSVNVQRFNFHSRSQHQEETISQFVQELRKLTSQTLRIQRFSQRDALQLPGMQD